MTKLYQPTPDDRATEFTAVKDTGEYFNGYTLMVEAYAAIWLVIMFWFVWIWRKQVGLNERVVGLEAALERAEKKLTKAKTEKAES